MIEPLGVLILSAVRHAGSYLPEIEATPGLEVRGIVEEASAPEWAHEDAERLGLRHSLRVSHDVDAALAGDDIDLVVVCSEPTRHARLAMLALDAGKHVLLDKPFATTLDDATELMLRANRSHGRFTMMHRLFSPQIERARGAIDAGHIGLPLALDMEWLASDGLSGEAVERPEFVTDTALSGGGELMNFLTYPITTVRWLTNLEIRSIYAEAGTFFFDHHKTAGVEDLGMLSLELERDVVASITVGRVPQAPSHGAVSATLRVIGSHGHLVIDEGQPTVDVWQPKERRGKRIGSDAGPRAVQGVLGDVVEAIRHGRAPRLTASDGWATIAAIDATYRSIRSGQPVEVRTRDDAISGAHQRGKAHELQR